MVKLAQLFISVALIGAIFVTASPLPQPSPATRASVKNAASTALTGAKNLGSKFVTAAKNLGGKIKSSVQRKPTADPIPEKSQLLRANTI
ncbi:hypothetical protein H4R33_000673 [Dimargaris cristalligena]|nr:hypothetical protein H4R33_000673 [Dimargaris cristalligena]